MPRLLNMLFGRAALLQAPIDDSLDGAAHERQFDGSDPDDSDTPGANNDGSQKIGDAPPAAPAPAPAAPAPAPAAPPAGPGTEGVTGDDPDDEGAAAPAAPAQPPAAAPAADPAAAPAADPGAAAAPPAADPPALFEPPKMQREARAPADAKERITSLETELDSALTRYNDGEIDLDAYRAEQRRITTEQQQLRSAIAVDEAADALRKEAILDRWEGMRNEAVREIQTLGVKMDETTYGDFAATVRMYAERGAARGMTDANLSLSAWALEQGKKAFLAEHGITAGGKPPAPAPAPAAPAAAPAAGAKPPAAPAPARQTPADRQVDRSALPPTLANAPVAADVSTNNGNPFAHLDGLEGMALEREIAKMSKADQEAYLNQ